MDEQPGRNLPAVIASILLVLLVIVVLAVILTPPLPVLPRIVPDPDLAGSPPVNVTHRFLSGDRIVTITVPVNVSVVSGAEVVQRRVVHVPNTTDIRGEIYRAMIDDPAQDPVYEAILSQLRAVREEYGLTDDGYVELLAAYVQSMDYTAYDAPVLYPVETVMEGSGDCDDLSLLLAGLLAREDYPVVLLLFRPEKHMAVGIGPAGPFYRSTGITYIETTAPLPPGTVPRVLRGPVTLESEPLVITVSTGTKRYPEGGWSVA